MYLSIQEMAQQWEISDRRLVQLCNAGEISGAFKDGGRWKIPEDCPKPVIIREKKNKYCQSIVAKQ